MEHLTLRFVAAALPPRFYTVARGSLPLQRAQFGLHVSQSGPQSRLCFCKFGVRHLDLSRTGFFLAFVRLLFFQAGGAHKDSPALCVDIRKREPLA